MKYMQLELKSASARLSGPPGPTGVTVQGMDKTVLMIPGHEAWKYVSSVTVTVS